MLPGYLALVVRGDGQPHAGSSQRAAVGRAIVATAAMALGFVTVFGIFGLLAVSLASTLQQYLPYVTVLIGISLVALGIWLIIGRELTGLIPNPVVRSARWAPTARLGSMFGYGVGYAIASLSCTIGPFLAVTGAAFRGGSVIEGLLIYLAYAAGMTLVVGVLAVAAALASATVAEKARRILPYVNRISGALLLVAGLYVGYYGVYEVRLFHFGGDPNDPVISAAGEFQGALVGWVDGLGAWPWLIVLTMLGGGVGAWSVIRNRRRSER